VTGWFLFPFGGVARSDGVESLEYLPRPSGERDGERGNSASIRAKNVSPLHFLSRRDNIFIEMYLKSIYDPFGVEYSLWIYSSINM
jgi:hypothetical protein